MTDILRSSWTSSAPTTARSIAASLPGSSPATRGSASLSRRRPWTAAASLIGVASLAYGVSTPLVEAVHRGARERRPRRRLEYGRVRDVGDRHRSAAADRNRLAGRRGVGGEHLERSAGRDVCARERRRDHDERNRRGPVGRQRADSVWVGLRVGAEFGEVAPVRAEDGRLSRHVEAAAAPDRDEDIGVDLAPSVKQVVRGLDALRGGRAVEHAREPVAEPLAYRAHQVVVGADVRAADDEGVVESPLAEILAEPADAAATEQDLTASVLVVEGVRDR